MFHRIYSKIISFDIINSNSYLRKGSYMKAKDFERIFDETAYVRWGGSKEELKCAQYLQTELSKIGLESRLESFDVQSATIKTAKLVVKEPYTKEIECKGYFNSGNANLDAPLYYLTTTDAFSLSQCKGKVVLIDTYLGYWKYKDIVDNGALAIIAYNGNLYFEDKDIQQRELRSFFVEDKKIPCFGIHVSDAVELVKTHASLIHIELEQEESISQSSNVICDIKGKNDKTIILTAHYDSVDNSVGTYDNMSGSVTILDLAQRFANSQPNYNLRFVWCGSEERGLLGSKAYVKDHKDELENVMLAINVDMIGTIMGNMISCCTSEDKLAHYIEYLALIHGVDMHAYQDVYSSDSTPFADAGIPAVSFARMAPNNCGEFHNRYDTKAVLSGIQLEKDAEFIYLFASNMANAMVLPVKKEMPENMKEALDKYLLRKR